jgi:hypothetical protein
MTEGMAAAVERHGVLAKITGVVLLTRGAYVGLIEEGRLRLAQRCATSLNSGGSTDMRWYALYSRLVSRFRSYSLLLLLGLLGLSTGPAWAQTSELRTWTSGQHKVEAKYVSVANGTVTLQQSDGEVLEIELDKLSAADRKYVADQEQKAASSPFKKKAASPFQKKGASSAGGRRAMAPAENEGSGGLVKPSWDGVQQIATTPNSSAWNIRVTSAAPSAASPRSRPIPIPPTTGFFQGPRGVVISGSGTKAAAGYAGGEPGGNRSEVTRVAVCDLEKSLLLGSGGQPGLYAPLAVRDDGTQILMRSDAFGPGHHERLEFWNVAKSGVVKGDQWIPYEDGSGTGPGDRDVRWATYLGLERFATISEAGHLVIWQVKPLKPLATLAAHSGCTPALSPDGKLLAFVTGSDIGVLDVATLEVVALQTSPMQNMAWASLSFSPTGKRLACQAFVTKVFVYDVADAAPYREISLQGLNVQQSPPVFSDDNHLIVGGHTLIDLESQVRLWQFQGNEHLVAANGVCWFEFPAKQNQSGALVPAKVPTPGVQESLNRAMRDPSFFIVKPGASVAVDANAIPDVARRNEVIQSLSTNLSKIGVTVAAGSPVTVQASLEQGKEEEVVYRKFGGGFQTERFKVRPWLSRIKVIYNGQVAWESSGTSLPMFEMARLEKNETLQDHVRKREQPNYAYFANAELPKLVTRPTGQSSGTLGVSTVTAMGIR